MTRRTPPPESAVQLARANLASAKAGLCGHGVACCNEKHDEETT